MAERVVHLTAVLWREEDAWVSYNPETGVASCGDTYEEAAAMLKEAVELYLEDQDLDEVFLNHTPSVQHMDVRISA
jgi:predicted RNase H-like HicB family nuclease